MPVPPHNFDNSSYSILIAVDNMQHKNYIALSNYFQTLVTSILYLKQSINTTEREWVKMLD